MKTRITIVGGGIAGVAVAKTLLEKTGGEAEIQIITKDEHYTAGPSRPLILTGEQQLDRITRGYEELIPKGIKVTHGLVTKINPEERKVEIVQSPPSNRSRSNIEYDILVVAPGVVYDGSSIEGYEQARGKIANVYEIGRVYTLKHWVHTITKGRIIVYAPPMPYRCAPAPSETTLLINTILKARKVGDKVEVIHVDANDAPQPPVIAKEITSLFEENGISLIAGRKIIGLEKDKVVLDDGEELAYDILALLEPNRAPDFVIEAGLGSRWFEVRSPENLRHVKYDDILAAGDVAKLPFPKNQEIAYESALHAVNNIIDELGLGEPIKVQYTFLGWVYVGNTSGELQTKSLLFGLNFTQKPPKPTKDPEPKAEYTKAKDEWEQAYLKSLFGH